MIGSILTVAMVLAILMAVVFGVYTGLIVVPYLRRRRWETGDAGDFRWHFLVPCRDEEAVVGATCHYLRDSFPETNVWIIDDDSEDRTREIVASLLTHVKDPGPGRLHLIRRQRPNARLGKAQALNHAWAVVRADIERRHGDLGREIIIVVDADGRPSPNFLAVMAGAGCFADPDVSLVQAEVRMRNRGLRRPMPEGDWLQQLAARLFIRMQDIEFRGAISATQMTRRVTNTVNAGGNGQAARASALALVDQGDGPWGESLVEDLELGLHILFSGGTNAYTTDAYVDQEALFSLQRYLVQCARWSRGTMQCSEYVPDVWKAPRVTNAGVVEMTLFLMQPWNQLVGSIVFLLPPFALHHAFAFQPGFGEEFARRGGWWILGIILAIGVLEFAIWGILYWLKCERDQPFVWSLVWGACYLVYVFINYPVVWRAFTQLVSGKQGWAKTRRNDEVASTTQIARFD